MKKIFKIKSYIRRIYKNLYYFSTLKKRVYFGKNSVVKGNVKIGSKVIIDDNVEIRNLSKETSFIGNNSSFNRNTVLRRQYNIGSNVAVGPNCSIMGFNHRFNDADCLISKQERNIIGIIIENNV